MTLATAQCSSFRSSQQLSPSPLQSRTPSPLTYATGKSLPRMGTSNRVRSDAAARDKADINHFRHATEV
ncbi:hypothetical protein K443DRAFT_676164 [Laccaria amethystina LaAM-08-1]|uniref:Uncharacterized protein n=1 Tax=Laccaria amethystina LaAM-08-1 TaxID=1095629 RepID=A0A0C9XGW2_9AGAR|nr:hypothetical protein K443DRAFT_676164 [Laccaria amethystina LaAM-08-1]